MIRKMTMMVAALALAAGCTAHKQTTKNRAEAPKEEKAATATDDHETVGEYGEKVADKTKDAADTTVDKAEQAGETAAEATRDAADATVAEGERVDENAEKLGGNAAEATRDAADDTLRETDRAEEKVLGSKEKVTPERGVDTPKNDAETPNPGDKEDDVVAEKPAAAIGTQVTAKLGTVDRKKKQVVFLISEGVDEISLQSGKEITVPFMDLQLLTGMQKDKAIEALQEAGDIQVRVFGKGDTMRIVEINMDEKKDVDIKMDENEK